MTRNKGAPSAGGANSPRAEEAEYVTDPEGLGQDIFEMVDVAEEEQTKSRDFRGGYRSIHESTDHQFHSTHEADEADHDEGMHAQMVDEFEDPRNLTAPTPRKGFFQCWVNNTPQDLRRMMKRGYRPRDPATLSKADFGYQTRRDQALGGVIEAAGMILMEMDEHTHQRKLAAEDQSALRLKQASMEHLRETSAAGVRRGAAPIEISYKES